MTRHTIFTFQLHRKGVVLIVLGCIVIAVLLTLAGYFAGVAHATAAQTKETPATAAAGPAPAVAAPPGVAPPPAAARPPEEFAIRLGQATSEEEAKALQAELKVREIDTTIVTLPTESGVPIFSLLAGRYPSRAAAAEDATKLEDRKGVAAVIVPAPPKAAPGG